MHRRKLGRTDLLVSEIGLDARHLGRVGATSAGELLDAYHAAGGNFLQCAGVVTDAASTAAETLVGAWLRDRPGLRAGLVLATRLRPEWPAQGGSIARVNAVRAACERSLRRLRVSHLDLLVCEWHDELGDVDDVLEACDQLVRAGRLRHAVAAEFPLWRLADSLHRAQLRGRGRFEALQTGFPIGAPRRREREALALCAEHRLGLLAEPRLADAAGSRADDALPAVLALQARELRASAAQVALAWMLSHPPVASVVEPVSTAGGMQDLLGATRLALQPAAGVS